MHLINSLVHIDPFKTYHTSCVLCWNCSFFFIFPKNDLNPPWKNYPHHHNKPTSPLKITSQLCHDIFESSYASSAILKQFSQMRVSLESHNGNRVLQRQPKRRRCFLHLHETFRLVISTYRQSHVISLILILKAYSRV